MVTSETFSSSGTALSGSTDLIGSLNIAALGSEDLTGILTAIRSTGAYSPRAEKLSTLDTETAFNLDQGLNASSTEGNTSDLLSQPTIPIAATHNAGQRAITADVDSLTGTSTSAPLVSPAAAQAGRIQVLTSVPDRNFVPNRVVFSTVNEQVRAPKTLLLTNTGTGPLTVTLNVVNSNQGIAQRPADNNRAVDFKLTGATAGTPFTIQAGQSREIAVQFAPLRTALNSNDSITDTLNGESYASLVIRSNDSTRPTSVVQLAGLNAADYEGDNEYSVAEITRAFGWTTDIGTASQRLGGSKAPLGDEVYSPYWLRADKSQPVQLWALARISSRQDLPSGRTLFKYRGSGPGETLYRFAGRNNDDNVPGSNNLSGGENQKLLPKIFIDGSNVVQSSARVGFNPTKAFALVSSGTQTDDTKNGPEQLRNWRVFAIRDSQGNIVRNTWLATQDNGNTTQQFKNNDYQDGVFLLTNAKPESAAADFSGDAKSDILWRNQATGANLLWRMDGTAFASSASLPTVKNPNWVVGGTGDANGDGKTDIFWRNQATGENAIWLMNRTARLSSVSLPILKNSNWQIGGTEDFNRDGNLDILWRNIATGRNSVWQLNGTTRTSSVALTAPIVKAGWRIVGTADYSGDGNADILWRNIANGQNSIWRMGGANGTTYASSASLPVVNPGAGWRIGATADYEGDGDPDIAWHNRSTGRSLIWKMNGVTRASDVALSPVANDSNWLIQGPR